MAYAREARYSTEKSCLEGTRTAIVNEVIDWVNGTLSDSTLNERRMLVLSGVAGSGKSAIAHTIARCFDRIGRLGASYCFSRSNQVALNPNNLFSTISRVLAGLDAQWKDALLKVIGDDIAVRTTHDVQEQFEKFLVKPAKEVRSIGPIVIVIDALDECGDRVRLLSVLAKRIIELPSHFRIIITTRPEQDIQEALLENPVVYSKFMDDIDKGSTIEDVRSYIQHELGNVPEFKTKGTNKEWLNALVVRSEGHFQWASTACLFIKGDGEGGLDPVEQMEILISSPDGRQGSKLERLDKLYMDILKHVFPTENAGRMARFRSVIGEILAAYEPLPISALTSLRSGTEKANIVNLIVRPLGAVLSGVSSRDTPVQPIHTSFRDFLLDEDRSGPFHVDAQVCHLPLVNGCLKTMASLLQFNICKLPSSFLRNSEVPGLHTRIKKHIPIHLSY